MSETPDRLPTTCPSCSPARETDHEVLSGGGSLTVRCSECGHVHKVQYERQRHVPVEVIVSQAGESVASSVEMPADQTIEEGEEFVLETEEMLATVRVTSLEVGEEQRAEAAPAEAVETVWSRAIDNVEVDVTIHPGDGPMDESKSVTYSLPGDFEFEVGAVTEIGGDELEIDALHLRNDATGYERERYTHEGDMAFAKDLSRVYAYDTRETARSAW